MKRRSATSVSGAQASISTRAREAVDQALPLLDGLTPLKADAAGDDVEAIKAIVRKQMLALVEELGRPGGPRVPRMGQLFRLLGGPKIGDRASVHSDSIGGTLGTLRDQFGFTCPVQEDEQSVTNFRIIADRITSLAQTWFSMRRIVRSRY
jgi:hypothetical protein